MALLLMTDSQKQRLYENAGRIIAHSQQFPLDIRKEHEFSKYEERLMLESSPYFAILLNRASKTYEKELSVTTSMMKDWKLPLENLVCLGSKNVEYAIIGNIHCMPLTAVDCTLEPDEAEELVHRFMYLYAKQALHKR